MEREGRGEGAGDEEERLTSTFPGRTGVLFTDTEKLQDEEEAGCRVDSVSSPVSPGPPRDAG